MKEWIIKNKKKNKRPFTATGNNFPPDLDGEVGHGNGFDVHGSTDDVAFGAEEDAIAEKLRIFVESRLDSEFVVDVVFHMGEAGFGASSCSFC